MRFPIINISKYANIFRASCWRYNVVYAKIFGASCWRYIIAFANKIYLFVQTAADMLLHLQTKYIYCCEPLADSNL